ncbi:MAG: hypothetical protein WAV30_00365 [Microgenomates group bacterium]
MVQLSKRMVKPEIMERILALLFDVIGKQNDRRQFMTILNGIFSPIEKIVIAKRIAIFLLLSKGIEWRIICDILKVSNASVSKCQMILLNNEEVRKIIKVFMRNEAITLFFDEFLLAFFGPGTAYMNWKTGLKRKKEIERKKSQIF